MNVNRGVRASFFKVALIAVVMSLFAVSCGGGDDDVAVESRVKNAVPEASAGSEVLSEADCKLLIALNNANLVDIVKYSGDDLGLDDLWSLRGEFLYMLFDFEGDVSDLISYSRASTNFISAFNPAPVSEMSRLLEFSSNLELIAGDNLSDLNDLLIDVGGSDENHFRILMDLVLSLEYFDVIRVFDSRSLLSRFADAKYRKEILGECDL